jgi:hypothetical protein
VPVLEPLSDVPGLDEEQEAYVRDREDSLGSTPIFYDSECRLYFVTMGEETRLYLEQSSVNSLVERELYGK